MQLSNHTYTNLYPTINYIPLQDYDSMSVGDIRDTLNDKFNSINFHENRINKSLLNLAISNPRHLNEFFSRYSGYVYYKKFQYPVANEYSFRDYFNNEAVNPAIDGGWIVFSCNDAGRCEPTDYLILIFDYTGKLIKPYNYKIRNLQSGLTIYVRKTGLYNNSVVVANHNAELLSEDYTLKVVVIKKKNVTNDLRFVSKTYVDSNVFDTTIDDMNTLTPLLDTNYYAVFKKTLIDNFYRPVHRKKYNTVVTDENMLSFTINEDIETDTTFLFMNTLDYSELNIIFNVNNSNELVITDFSEDYYNYNLINNKIDYTNLISQYTDNGNIKRIPLVTKIGDDYYPIPFKRVYDTYLWVNGLKLTPGVDYFIDYTEPVSSNNSNNIYVDNLTSTSIVIDNLSSTTTIIDGLGGSINNVNDYGDYPPSIVLCEDQNFPIDNYTHIRLVLNQPYHPKNLCAYFDNIHEKGFINFEKDIVSYSAKQANLSFSDGKFVSSDDIEILSSNLLHVKNIDTKRKFEYNFNYLINPDVSTMVDYFNDYESDLDKFIRYSGYNKNIINDYVDFNNLDYTLTDQFYNSLSCSCASTNFSRYVNIEVDRTNTYFTGYVLKVTGLRLNDDIVVLDGYRTNNDDIKIIDSNRVNNNCVLVIDCNER